PANLPPVWPPPFPHPRRLCQPLRDGLLPDRGASPGGHGLPAEPAAVRGPIASSATAAGGDVRCCESWSCLGWRVGHRPSAWRAGQGRSSPTCEIFSTYSPAAKGARLLGEILPSAMPFVGIIYGRRMAGRRAR